MTEWRGSGDYMSEYHTVFMLVHTYDPEFRIATNESYGRVEELDVKMRAWIQERNKDFKRPYTQQALFKEMQKEGYNLVSEEELYFPQTCEEIRIIDMPVAGERIIDSLYNKKE